MRMDGAIAATSPRPWRRALLACLGACAASALIVAAGTMYYRFANARFPNVGSSVWLATLWGVVSRAHLVVLAAPFVVLHAREMGFRVGQTTQHLRMLLIMLLANCGVVGAYLGLTGSGTPYSGDQWLLTEVITVPVVEETIWRGLVFAGVLRVLGPSAAPGLRLHLPAWASGVSFGVLHAANALAGVPWEFALIQALNATVWGVVYGYARAKTGSVYPPMLLHAAMNLTVVLF